MNRTAKRSKNDRLTEISNTESPNMSAISQGKRKILKPNDEKTDSNKILNESSFTKSMSL